MKLPKSMGKFDKRISQGAGRILRKYRISISKDGAKIYFRGKKSNRLRKIIYITPHGLYDAHYGSTELHGGREEYVNARNSRWVLAYFMSRKARRVPMGGWYSAKGKCCRTRLVQVHVDGYKEQQIFFECQLMVVDDWDWKRPILYPFEISLKPKERKAQVRELFQKYHIPAHGIETMIKIYSKHIGREKPLIGYKNINHIVRDLRSKFVELSEIVDGSWRNKCSCK